MLRIKHDSSNRALQGRAHLGFMARSTGPACIALACLALGGCSALALYPPAPASVSQGAYNYLIGPADTLSIHVWHNPELSVTVPVRPDGRISVPLVEDLVAVGKEPSALAREIESALSKVVHDPVVTVMPAQAAGVSAYQVQVVGGVCAPKALAYWRGMTLLDAISAVGGLSADATASRASILRTAEGNKQYSIRLRDLIKSGDATANVELKPGDVVFVPSGWL